MGPGYLRWYPTVTPSGLTGRRAAVAPGPIKSRHERPLRREALPARRLTPPAAGSPAGGGPPRVSGARSVTLVVMDPDPRAPVRVQHHLDQDDHSDHDAGGESPRTDTEGGTVTGRLLDLLPGALRTPRWRRWATRSRSALGVLVVVAVGAALGTALVPEVPVQVGPLALEVRVVPSLRPGVQLLLPPAGRVDFATHRAPLAVQARIDQVDLESARALLASPAGLQTLQRTAPDALRTATLQAGGLAAGYALAGGVGLSVLVHRRRWRRTAQVAATIAAVLTVTAATTAITFDADRFAQPRFEGLLSQAPYVASQTSGLVQRLETYRSGLADIVQNVTTLYAKSGQLPVIPGAGSRDVITVLHISDIHLNPLGFDLTDRLVHQFNADMVVDTGDITSWGTEVESATLARIRDVGVPYVFVRGNHDSLRTQRAVAANPNAVILDGGVAQVDGLVLAGLGDPRFTPDAQVTLPNVSSAPGTPPTSGRSSGPPGASGSAGPAPYTAAQAVRPGEDPELVEGHRLAGIIRSWNAAHPDRPVDIAAFHEPAGTPPLDGLVPLVLAGHLHTRSVHQDPNGTRLMIEGSTGGAGASGLDELAAGRPVPLAASVLYFARSGPRAGQLLAYDEVTVGGFGLASVSLERTVVRPDGQPQLAPGQVRGTAAACPTPSGGAGPSSAAAAPMTSGTPATGGDAVSPGVGAATLTSPAASPSAGCASP
jgi:predicted MPP superfamily phosphohydrolase